MGMLFQFDVVTLFMQRQTALFRVTFVAFAAGKGLDTRMDMRMLGKLHLRSESFVAIVAFEIVRGMGSHVIFQGIHGGKGFPACLTQSFAFRFFLLMFLHVHYQLFAPHELLLAQPATKHGIGIFRLSVVRHHVILQIEFIRENFAANVASNGGLLFVRYGMGIQSFAAIAEFSAYLASNVGIFALLTLGHVHFEFVEGVEATFACRTNVGGPIIEHHFDYWLGVGGFSVSSTEFPLFWRGTRSSWQARWFVFLVGIRFKVFTVNHWFISR